MSPRTDRFTDFATDPMTEARSDRARFTVSHERTNERTDEEPTNRELSCADPNAHVTSWNSTCCLRCGRPLLVEDVEVADP